MTLAELRDYVRDRLTIRDTDTDRTTEIDRVLNGARDRLVAEFKLLVSRANLTFTLDTEEVTLPAGVLRILSIRGPTYVLEPITDHELVDYAARFTATELGPLVYLVDGNSTTLRVWPSATATATVTNALRYVPQPTLLSDVAHEPTELPRGFHELLGEMAIYRIAQSEEADGIAAGAHRIIYGGGPGELGLMGELRQHMNRRPGSAGTRIWPRGYA